MVRIVERRGGICCCKNTLFLSESPNIFLENCILCMGFNAKSSNCHKNLIVIHWIFRKLSYLCPRIKAFFVYCKIQKRAEVRSFPYCYLYNIGKRPTSWFSIKVQFRASYLCYPTFYPSYFCLLKGWKVPSKPLFLAPKSIFLLLSLKKTILPFLSFLLE